MEAKAKRTLVKSAPELWQLANDRERMSQWMAGLLGHDASVAVEVTNREPERVLAWQPVPPGPRARIELELAEKGFGTSVEITALCPDHSPEPADSMLEGLLDELGSPERRPFVGA